LLLLQRIPAETEVVNITTTTIIIIIIIIIMVKSALVNCCYIMLLQNKTSESQLLYPAAMIHVMIGTPHGSHNTTALREFGARSRNVKHHTRGTGHKIRRAGQRRGREEELS